MTDRDPLREALKEDFATLREERDSWRRQAEDLADTLRACDRYINWHELRIVPTEDCPDQDTALALARAALDRQTP